MTRWEQIKAAVGLSTKAANEPVNVPQVLSGSAGHPYATGFWPCWPSQNPYVPLDMEYDFRQSSAVMACVNWLGTTLPSAPLQVQQRKDVKVWEPLPEHPLVDLLCDPNPWFSGITYWKAFSYWWLVYGNVYLYKARNAAGQVVELWLLDSRKVVPQWQGIVPQMGEADMRQVIYRYSGLGLPSVIAPTDLIHFRYGTDPDNPLLGLAPVRSLLYEIAADIEISTYMTQMLRNFGIPSFIVSPKPNSDNLYNVAEQELIEQMQQRTMGSMRGKPLAFNTPFDLKEFGFSPDQMTVEKASRRPESRICAVLGVPAIVLGFEVGLERSIYSNLRAAQEQGWDNQVIPTQDYIAATLTDNLLSEPILTSSGSWPGMSNDDAYRVIFDRSAVTALQEDRDNLSARVNQSYVAGIMKRSEARSALGLDTTPEDDVYMVEPGQPPAASIAIQTPQKPQQKALAPRIYHDIPNEADLQAISDWWDEYAPDDAVLLLKAQQAGPEFEDAPPDVQQRMLRAMAAAGIAWLFSKKRNRYIRTSDGRTVRRDTMKRWVNAVVDSSAVDTAQVGAALGAGDISTTQFQTKMTQQINWGHRALAAAAVGGLAAMTARYWYDTAQKAKQQQLYLTNMAMQDAHHQVSEAEAQNRAGMYSEAMWGTYWNAGLQASKDRGDLFATRILDPAAEHCADCPELAGRYPIQQVPPIGDSACRVRCRCWLLFDDGSGTPEVEITGNVQTSHVESTGSPAAA